MTDILEDARALLGTPVKIDERRRWATWWCPFHPDEQKAGVSGKPNFGLQIDEGYWKCLRCGASGGGIPALAKRLGPDGGRRGCDDGPLTADHRQPSAVRGLLLKLYPTANNQAVSQATT